MPANSPALNAQTLNLAITHHKAGRLSEATALYKTLLAQHPSHPDLLHLLGAALGQRGEFGSAVELIEQAITLKPTAVLFHNHLGVFLRAQGELARARAAFSRATELDPRSADAWNNLGSILLDFREPKKAVACFRSAIALNPRSADMHFNLGLALRRCKLRAEAAAAYRAAIGINPSHTRALSNLGTVLNELGECTAAVDVLQGALRIDHESAETHSDLGNVLNRQGRNAEALQSYRRAIELRPSDAGLHSNLLLALNYQSDPNPPHVFEEHLQWRERHAIGLRPHIQPPQNPRDPDRRLKIGYVSPDLRDHVVARFLVPLLERHDQSKFEITCYSSTTRPDAVTDRLRRYAVQWRDISLADDLRIADGIRADGIDILVDLAGHTGGNRLRIFACRPAPVQVSWLGYPNTTGLDTVDYRITDAHADPFGITEGFHSEQMFRLPQCAWCYPIATAPTPATHLPARPPTFGCFNNLGKINARIIRLWARLLQQTPGSRLVIKETALSDAGVRRRFHELFQSHRTPPECVLLLGRDKDYQSHLARYGEIDVALDSFPYHGTTTTCEALWMGTPVVTLAGTVHLSRVGVSLLSNVGLHHLIAQSEDDYIRIARELVQDRAALLALRQGLREQMRQSPLMDAARFTRDMEHAFRAMWHEWCSKSR